MRNQRAGEEVAGGGNVIAGFVPIIRKAKQRRVHRDENRREQNP
jgi:hypothetical protein